MGQDRETLTKEFRQAHAIFMKVQADNRSLEEIVCWREKVRALCDELDKLDRLCPQKEALP